MAKKARKSDRIDLLQGTLDVLILKTLSRDKEHGQGIARTIEAMSGNVFNIDHGSLYPALQRLEKKGYIRSEWGTSSNNRKARFYELTKAGRAQVDAEVTKWRRLSAAMARVLAADEGGD